MPLVLKIVLLFALLGRFSCLAHTPIVMWHGMGDTCCNPITMGMLSKSLKETMPGVHVLSLRIGKNILEDFLNGFIMHPDKMIQNACKIIKSDALLANGYNAIGVSQGSQFLRGLAQRCPEPRMKNLITMAGQHQGVYGLPTCDGVSKPLCRFIHQMINYSIYTRFIQKRIVQATYWHNPLDEDAYRNGNTFIAVINNERIVNQTYIKNLQSLENFVMDRLGLKQMDKDGKLHFLSVPWKHLQFDWAWFEENIVDKFLR